MKKIKKLALVLMAAVMMLSLTGCMGGTGESIPTLNPDGGTSSGQEIKLIEQSEVEDNLQGLCDYLKGNNVITGDSIEMSYDIIGAIGGYRYAFSYNSQSITVEVYEFDLDNLNEEAKNCLDQIKADGKFKVLDKEVEAVISKSGKYIMIDSDTNTDEKNVQLKEKTQELFENFKA